MLASSLCVAFRFNARGSLGSWLDALGPFVGMVGAVTALWLVHRGGEVRRRITVDATAVTVRQGRFEHTLLWSDVRELRWQAPFTARGLWLSALAVVDSGGRVWRVPAMIGDGPGLLRAMLRCSERSDLRAWAEALSLERRLRRAPWIVAGGYTIALAIVAVGAGFYFR